MPVSSRTLGRAAAGLALLACAAVLALRAHDRISGGSLVGVLNLVAWSMRQRSRSAIGC